MSRAEKEQRRRRRRERKEQQARHRPRFELSPPPVLVDGDSTFQLASYDITTDALEDSAGELSRIEDVLPDGADARHRLFDQVHDQPQVAIPILESLLEQLPGSRVLLNWLASAYSRAGNWENAERIARLNYERNPDYLFARVGYADICLQRGELDQIPVIFDGKFDLKLLYPQRSTFHISEFVAFSSVMIEYFIRIDDFERAEMLQEALEKVAPDSEITQRLGQMLVTSSLLKSIRGLAEYPRRRRRNRLR